MNRDPDIFPEPDHFDIGKEGAHSFSFGWSAHRCLGTPIALAEVQEVLIAFFTPLEKVELVDCSPVWVPFSNLNNNDLTGDKSSCNEFGGDALLQGQGESTHNCCKICFEHLRVVVPRNSFWWKANCVAKPLFSSLSN